MKSREREREREREEEEKKRNEKEGQASLCRHDINLRYACLNFSYDDDDDDDERRQSELPKGKAIAADHRLLRFSWLWKEEERN